MLRKIAATAAVLCFFTAARGDVVYVDDDAPPGGDGSSWETARNFLFSAMMNSAAGDEIRVAGGDYHAELASFPLKSNVAVRGGYRGLSDRGDPDDRDPAAYRSRLTSGQPHVVRAVAVDGSAILDGFEISLAVAKIDHFPFEEDDDCGAAVYALHGAPTIRACRFVDNVAADDGGAIFGGAGVLENCIFIRNNASDFGGAIYDIEEGWDIRNCVFRNNRAAFGGAFAANSSAANCLFDHNQADFGAAIYGGREILNCTIVNHAESAATFCVTLVDSIGNSILWGNALLPSGVVTYSCIENWTGGGVGNVARSPQFRDADGADDIPGTADDDFRLSSGSPCIDAADSSVVPPWSSVDLRGDPRIADDPLTLDTGVGSPISVDMGAHEVNRCAGDVNGDFAVDLQDLAGLLSSFGRGGDLSFADGDLNGDSVIDAQDLQILLSSYGRCPD